MYEICANTFLKRKFMCAPSFLVCAHLTTCVHSRAHAHSLEGTLVGGKDHKFLGGQVGKCAFKPLYFRQVPFRCFQCRNKYAFIHSFIHSFRPFLYRPFKSYRGTGGKLVGGASWCLRYKITMRGRKT